MDLEYVLILVAVLTLILNSVCGFFYVKNIKNIKLTSMRYDKTTLQTNRTRTSSATFQTNKNIKNDTITDINLKTETTLDKLPYTELFDQTEIKDK